MLSLRHVVARNRVSTLSTQLASSVQLLQSTLGESRRAASNKGSNGSTLPYSPFEHITPENRAIARARLFAKARREGFEVDDPSAEFPWRVMPNIQAMREFKAKEAETDHINVVETEDTEEMDNLMKRKGIVHQLITVDRVQTVRV